VKSCSYCGRENADDSRNCRECGTEFAAQTEESLPKEVEKTFEVPIVEAPMVEPPVEALMTDLSELDMGFEVVKG
jgi:hypothetical protein